MADLLSTARSGLFAAQRSLVTTGHNVANVGTPGYSRQRVDQAASAPQYVGVGYVGTGVQTTGIQRLADSLVFGRGVDSSGELGRLQQLAASTQRLDTLFSDSATALATPWSAFFDAVQGVASEPSSAAARQQMLSQAEGLGARFNMLDGQLSALDRETSEQLRGHVDEVNRLSAEIAGLNAAIGRSGAPDLLDQRERLVGDLVSLTGGTAVMQDGGTMNVFTGGGQALVVGANASALTVTADPFRPDRAQVALSTPGGQVALPADAFGGRIGGLMAFRRDVLDPAQAELGRLAVGLAQTFNALHAEGTDFHGQPGGAFFDVPAPRVAAHAGNTGGAAFSAGIEELAALTGQAVTLRFDGSGWSAQRSDTGAPVPLDGSGTAEDPLRVGGVALVLDGTPAAGDRFELQPTAGAAGGLGVAIQDPGRIAAGSPVAAQAALGNQGSGVVAGLDIADGADPALRGPAEIRFLDAGTYSIDGGLAQAFAPGAAIAHNGWSLTLDGVPAAGDRFQVGPVAAGSSDNGTARRLAGVADLPGLDGGTRSLNAALGQLTTSVGSAARQAGYALEGQAVIHAEVQAQRESVSGVNLDEEAANMLRYQQAYMAASQMIGVADTLFQTLLGAVRR